MPRDESLNERGHKPRFDFTINISNVISVALILVSLFAFFNKLESRLTAIEVKVDKMWSNYWTLK